MEKSAAICEIGGQTGQVQNPEIVPFPVQVAADFADAWVDSVPEFLFPILSWLKF
jgi:hypothetical protein